MSVVKNTTGITVTSTLKADGVDKAGSKVVFDTDTPTNILLF